MKTILKKIGEIGEYVPVCFGVLIGIAFFGFLAGGLTMFLLHTVLPSFPVEAVTPPADNMQTGGAWQLLR
jgi:hypothetical protein